VDLHWTSLLYPWCQNEVPYQEPFSVQLFQMIHKRLYTRMCSYECIFLVVTARCMNDRSGIQC
jgi:hypothetical protein